MKEFDSKIHQVSLKSRYFAWYSLFILLIIGLLLVYVSSFADLYDTETESESPFSDSTKQRLLFLFFWTGVYSNSDYEDYATSVYPFYIIVLFLVIERLA